MPLFFRKSILNFWFFLFKRQDVDFLNLDKWTVFLFALSSFLLLVVSLESLLVSLVELGTMTVFVRTVLWAGGHKVSVPLFWGSIELILVAEMHIQKFVSSVQLDNPITMWEDLGTGNKRQCFRFSLVANRYMFGVEKKTKYLLKYIPIETQFFHLQNLSSPRKLIHYHIFFPSGMCAARSFTLQRRQQCSFLL